MKKCINIQIEYDENETTYSFDIAEIAGESAAVIGTRIDTFSRLWGKEMVDAALLKARKEILEGFDQKMKKELLPVMMEIPIKEVFGNPNPAITKVVLVVEGSHIKPELNKKVKS